MKIALRVYEAQREWDSGRDVICPGCERHIYEEEADSLTYPDEVWHGPCAYEDRRINACQDASDRYAHQYDN